MRYAVIMAGGSGTRLWPLSTAARPKQLIPLLGGKSLLRIAADRLDALVPPPRRFIAASARFRDQIAAALPEVPPANILGEPAVRDTLAAMGLAAAVLRRTDPDAVIAVFTADHLIEPLDSFRDRIETGFALAERRPDALITFGIEPTHPATGYGYVELADAVSGVPDAYRTASFREKPDAATAQRYLSTGRYLWNSGMFVWRASALLGAIEKYEPVVAAGLDRIAAAWGGAAFDRALADIYPTLRKTSVDFGVMERAAAEDHSPVYTVRMPVRWVDVGSFGSLAATIAADDAGNRVDSPAAAALDAAGNLVVSHSPDHLVALFGVENLVVVRTDRATLICSKQHADDLKRLHALLRERGFDQYL